MYLPATREIHLVSRPIGLPAPENFTLLETSVPPLQHGEVLVKNLWMSVDPYMRGRMMDRESYVAPFQLGQVLEGGALGVVVESLSSRFKVGEHVLSASGWREHFVTAEGQLQKIDAHQAPLSNYLGALGMTGMTAWVGLTRIAELKAGETVFVSAASGAVGSMVCQIAKQLGARVVGSVGSEEKAQILREMGVDAVINYRTAGDLTAALQVAAPEGIDVYFENVGGEHLVAALNVIKRYGRIVMCGLIDQYNATSVPVGPANIAQMVIKSLKMQGFIVRDHWTHYSEFLAQVTPWLVEGKIQSRETVVAGLENAPAAFIGLFKGDNIGKMLVKLA